MNHSTTTSDIIIELNESNNKLDNPYMQSQELYTTLLYATILLQQITFCHLWINLLDEEIEMIEQLQIKIETAFANLN
tara:strand:- start:217 stop:450 length:234 start_codon:yes stop_codon:yes gene_type:complete